MEKILQNGTRVISFAPDDESTRYDSYKVNTTINYDIRTDDQKEDFQERGEDFELVPQKFINLTPP